MLDPAQTLYLFDPQFHAGHFQILGAKTLQHSLIEECLHGQLEAQAAEELEASRKSRSAFSQSSTSCPSL